MRIHETAGMKQFALFGNLMPSGGDQESLQFNNQKKVKGGKLTRMMGRGGGDSLKVS